MNILVLAPHTDDAELGCGGTLARYLEEGHKVSCVVFSVINPSIEPDWTLMQEFLESMKTMGIEDTAIHDFPMRRLDSVRQDILEELYRIKAGHGIDMVFLPSSHDLHQDHRVVSRSGIRAFKDVTTLGYELPWNNLTFDTQSFIILKDRHIDKKIEALSAYNSQKEKVYMHSEFIKAMAIARGGQIGAHYAEAFEVIRWIQD
jgi:LmbE family N-acetylglucosaminyl deacetylase